MPTSVRVSILVAPNPAENERVPFLSREEVSLVYIGELLRRKANVKLIGVNFQQRYQNSESASRGPGILTNYFYSEKPLSQCSVAMLIGVEKIVAAGRSRSTQGRKRAAVQS
jgi:hypothetical protein